MRSVKSSAVKYYDKKVSLITRIQSCLSILPQLFELVWNNFNFDPKVKICYFYVYIILKLSSNMNEESFEFTQYIILQEKFVTVFEITVLHSNLTSEKYEISTIYCHKSALS